MNSAKSRKKIQITAARSSILSLKSHGTGRWEAVKWIGARVDFKSLRYPKNLASCLWGPKEENENGCWAWDEYELSNENQYNFIFYFFKMILLLNYF